MRTEQHLKHDLPAVPVRSVQSAITVRHYDPQRDDIDRLRSGSQVDERDSVFVAESGGRIVGILVERLIPVVHTFELEPSPIARRVADALIHYGKGFTKASGYKEVTFYVEPGNVNMQAYIEGHGAVKEENADVYTMEIK